MPKISKQLSELAVKRLTTEGKHRVGGVQGLVLRVTDTGHRGWVLRVQVGDKRRDMGLGAYPEVGLAAARDKAREIHASLRRGEVPTSPARQRRQAIAKHAIRKTFKQCAEGFMADKSSEWKNAKHRQQWENTLATYAYPHIGDMDVSEIDLPHILACLEPIWKTKTETASRLRGRIESVLDWSTVRKYRTGENPARLKGHLDMVLPKQSQVQKVEHHPALPIDDMPAFVADLRQREGAAARALEFAILCASRSGEVRGAKWAEFDLEAAVWTVPAERMKMKKEHRVPLSAEALKLLKATQATPGTDLVFPGTKGQPLSDMSLTAVIRRMNTPDVRWFDPKQDNRPVVPHGARSTFRDWAGDRTHYPRELTEAALSHALPNAVEAAYRRGDGLEKRREMMQAWADYIKQDAKK